MTINEMMQRAFDTAAAHGWTEDNRTFGDHIALMHSELSEALEDFRAGNGLNETWTTAEGKLRGIPYEFADVVIRLGQFCQESGIDLEKAIEAKMAYNDTREWRHGGKVI